MFDNQGMPNSCTWNSPWPPRPSHIPLQYSGDTRHRPLQALCDQTNENVSSTCIAEGNISITLLIVDDRFDPYASSSKRRAVSPSVSSYFRDAHSSLRTPGTPRLSIPIGIPVNPASSATGSPTVGVYATSVPRNGSIGHMSVSSSPTMRATMSLASPVLRPIPRVWRGEGEGREVEGAGEAVGGLTLE